MTMKLLFNIKDQTKTSFIFEVYHSCSLHPLFKEGSEIFEIGFIGRTKNYFKNGGWIYRRDDFK